MRKNNLINLCLLVFSLIFCVVLVEISVRYLKLAPEIYLVSHNIFQLSEDSDLGYELKPNSSWEYKGINYDINSQGRRGPVYGKKKTDRTFRIALIGDSITFGLWVPYVDSYAYKLSQLLNSKLDSDYNYEVVNLGVSGYTSENLSASILEANELNPDIIIYGYCMNDPQEYSGEFNKLKRLNGIEKRSSDKHFQILFESALFRTIYFNFFYDSGKREKSKEHANKLTSVDNPQFKAIEVNAEKEYLESIHKGAGLVRLESATDIMAKFKDKLLVVVFPSFPVPVDPAEYQFGSVHFVINDNFKKSGISTLDLLDSYQTSAASGDIVHQDKIHPNSAGHSVAANQIFQYLKANVDLP